MSKKILLLLLFCSILGISCTGRKPEEKIIKPSVKIPKKGVISGHAYVILGSGESYILRGLNVYLLQDSPEFNEKNQKLLDIKASIASETAQIFSEVNSTLETGSATGHALKTFIHCYGKLASVRELAEYDMKECEFFYKTSAMAKTRVDFEGAYQFKNLPLDNYYVYAKYETSFNEGYWLIPITVEPSKTTVLDLDNDTFSDEHELFQLSSVEFTEQSLFEIMRIGGYSELQLAELRLEGIKLVQKFRESPPFDYPAPVGYLEKEIEYPEDAPEKKSRDSVQKNLDIIYLKNGNIARGVIITEDENGVTLSMHDGAAKITFTKEEILKIEKRE